MSVAEKIEGEARQLKVRPLEASAFAPFGQIVELGEHPQPANGGTAQRHDIGDVMTRLGEASQLRLSIFDCEPQALPLKVDVLERHRLSAQTIAPMQASDYLTIVCLSAPNGAPDLSTAQAFECSPHQGVNYSPGVWHHGIVAIERRSLFFLQSWQDGSPADCEEINIPALLVTR
jgi:ureidoglycolate lyase